MKMSRIAFPAASLGAFLAIATCGPAMAQQMPVPSAAPTAGTMEMAQNTQQPGYWHGYRGSRTERAGTRLHDGYWYPLAAFGVEPSTTGSIGSPMARPMQRQTYCQNTFGGTNGDGSMPCDNGY